MTESGNSELSRMIEDFERQVEMDAANLRHLAVRLAKSMESLTKAIDDGHLGRINELGEVQNQGTAVDVACAKLGADRAALEHLRSKLPPVADAIDAEADALRLAYLREEGLPYATWTEISKEARNTWRATARAERESNRAAAARKPIYSRDAPSVDGFSPAEESARSDGR